MCHTMAVTRRQFQLNESEVRALQVAYETCRNGPVRTRLQAVRLYGTGYPTDEIETITGVGRRVLLRWCGKYRQGGIAALDDQRKGGNHRTLTAEQVAQVRAKLHQYRPVDVLGAGHVATAAGLYWTISDLKQALLLWQNVTYKSDSSYRNLLLACGFSFQRAGKQYRSRSEAKLADFAEQLEKN